MNISKIDLTDLVLVLTRLCSVSDSYLITSGTVHINLLIKLLGEQIAQLISDSEICVLDEKEREALPAKTIEKLRLHTHISYDERYRLILNFIVYLCKNEPR